MSGQPGLRLIKGFHDETLSGQWTGHRSSRLGIRWRVIYRVEAAENRVLVVAVTAHDCRRAWMKGFRPAKKRVEVSVGESVRVLRGLQELSQNDLAGLTGIPQSTISAIENDRVRLGVERAKVLARALKCHPGVLVFPGWTVEPANAA